MTPDHPPAEPSAARTVPVYCASCPLLEGASADCVTGCTALLGATMAALWSAESRAASSELTTRVWERTVTELRDELATRRSAVAALTQEAERLRAQRDWCWSNGAELEFSPTDERFDEYYVVLVWFPGMNRREIQSPWDGTAEGREEAVNIAIATASGEPQP